MKEFILTRPYVTKTYKKASALHTAAAPAVQAAVKN